MFVCIERGPLSVCKEIYNRNLAEEPNGFYRQHQDDPNSHSNGDQGTRLQTFFYYSFFYFSHL